MRQELEGAERLIRELRTLITRCGWAGKAPDLVVEGVVSVLTRYLVTGRPLLDLVEETLSLPSFTPVRRDMEVNLILNTLIFLYDRQLMEKSRDLLSHLAAELDRAPEAFLNRVNENLAKKEPDYPPIPHLVDGEPRFGVSLVLAFEYPHVFVNAVNESFSKFPLHLPPGDGPPGSNGAYITDQMHFTLLNVGIDCPGPEADRLVTAVKPPLSRLICTDFAVGSAVRVMCDQATVRPIFRIMPDGSIILLGSGAEFLRAFCDFRQSVLPVIERLTSGSEAYNIWMHTVYARPPKELTASQIEIIAKAAESLENEGRERIKLENARFAIMKFKDKKAILPPDALHAYNLAGHEWVES